jgi:hypothetical protein
VVFFGLILRFSSSAVLSQGYSVSARSISRKSPLRRRLTPKISVACWASPWIAPTRRCQAAGPKLATRKPGGLRSP